MVNERSSEMKVICKCIAENNCECYHITRIACVGKTCYHSNIHEWDNLLCSGDCCKSVPLEWLMKEAIKKEKK